MVYHCTRMSRISLARRGVKRQCSFREGCFSRSIFSSTTMSTISCLSYYSRIRDSNVDAFTNVYQNRHRRVRYYPGQHYFSTSVGSIGNNHTLYKGPHLQLGTGKLALHADSSIIGSTGSTVVMSTVTKKADPSLSDTMFTVEYRQRYHAIGEIPTSNRQRKDGGAVQQAEVLAARAIDRALRPLIKSWWPFTECDKDHLSTPHPLHLHLSCSLQAYDRWNILRPVSPPEIGSTVDNPIVLAINSASAALAAKYLTEPVAATAISVMSDGSYIQDATPIYLDQLSKVSRTGAKNFSQELDCVGTLLYAGTRTHAVMIEWNGTENLPSGLPEENWQSLLDAAHASIQLYLDVIDDLKSQIVELGATEDIVNNDKEMRIELGLEVSNEKDDKAHTSSDTNHDGTATRENPGNLSLADVDKMIVQCAKHMQKSQAHHRIFGYTNDTKKHTYAGSNVDLRCFIHDGDVQLLPKQYRGMREHVVTSEIRKFVDLWLETHHKDRLNASEHAWLQNHVSNKVMRDAFATVSERYRTRADGRSAVSDQEDDSGESFCSPLHTIRPISVQAPALPPTVHGSAIFQRGDTQVLCTTTIGPPRDSMSNVDSFSRMDSPYEIRANDTQSTSSYYSSLPIGSTRFTKTQEALLSDMNTQKSIAAEESVGDSGIFSTSKRAFLQYDFPPYSTGSTASGGGGSSSNNNRRAIGHGALAEKAILPVLPPTSSFPYTIRMTSEVTDSNGSSSMASVCGVTLALMDAGVPIEHPVVGLSVGCTTHGNNDTLIIDLTGTEDYYGNMDFKIAGTSFGVTALQLDVKKPVQLSVLGRALALGQKGRETIIDEINEQYQQRRSGLKPTCPRVEIVKFDPTRKRDLVGPGGVILRQLEDRHGVSLDLSQEGQCLLFGWDVKQVIEAKNTVRELVADIVPGEVYQGTVTEIKDFGAIIELLRNKEGLLHVSELTNFEEAKDHPDGVKGFVEQNMYVGQVIDVLCIAVDPVQGAIKLSRKALLQPKKESS